ncbi:hypothetical protein KOW79_021219 [Hemibagrus wyckioides]|uniref:Uncharacterized protein n=1 Tax=Hemibagrus wyckioides TaxID=337641 RepID=A0A9D3N238_9TELE|nr:hypothetical protein KOW79_021219 [Hemibagrus wyckioides]
MARLHLSSGQSSDEQGSHVREDEERHLVIGTPCTPLAPPLERMELNQGFSTGQSFSIISAPVPEIVPLHLFHAELWWQQLGSSCGG